MSRREAVSVLEDKNKSCPRVNGERLRAVNGIIKCTKGQSVEHVQNLSFLTNFLPPAFPLDRALFFGYAALCLSSGGNISFGYIIFDELVLKCCARYSQNLRHAHLITIRLLVCP